MSSLDERTPTPGTGGPGDGGPRRRRGGRRARARGEVEVRVTDTRTDTRTDAPGQITTGWETAAGTEGEPVAPARSRRTRRAAAKAAKADRRSGNHQTGRGFSGRGGGLWRLLPVPATYRGTTVQVCGLWPFAAGSARPNIGVPVGIDIETGASIACDHFDWFRAGLISSASVSLLGLPGLGKSSYAIRQILGLADRGIVSIVAGDLKGEYTQVVSNLVTENPDGSTNAGQVISFGSGQQLNVLDQGAMLEVADQLDAIDRAEGGPGIAGATVRSWAIDRAAQMVATLLQIVRRGPVADWEQALIRRALRTLVDLHHAQQLAGGEVGPAPALPDLAALLLDPSADLLATILVDTRAEYLAQTKVLNRSMQAVLDGPLGSTFSGQTTERIRLDAPAVSIDISVVARQSDDVLAAIMLAAWSEVYATVEASNALTDAGPAPQRYVNIVMDEMWRPMRLQGAQLVDKLDSITRLNRNDGMGNMFITHSLKDFSSMESASDNIKARGFVERSGIVVTAGLAREDLRELSKIKPLSEKEISTVASWATPPGWQARMVTDPVTGSTRPATAPGAGKVLIKVGDRAGVQCQVILTDLEKRLHDTNVRWITEGKLTGPTLGR